MRRTSLDAAALVVLVASVLVVVSPVRAGANTWTPLGPSFFGRLSAFIVDPQTPTTLYAVATLSSPQPGIYKTTDDGKSWQWLDLAAPNGEPNINFLTLDPTNPSILYAGVGYAGVYRSNDVGETWQAINNGLPITPETGTPGVALAVHPTTPTTLYVVLNYVGLFRSTDGGASWSRRTDGLPPSDEFLLPNDEDDGYRGFTYRLSILAIDPQTPTTVYLALPSGIFKSDDGGDTWASGSGLDPLSFVHSVVIDHQTPTTLYAVTSTGIFKTTNGAASWVNLPGVSELFGGHPAPTLLIVPGSPETLLITSGYFYNQFGEQARPFYRSTDGGHTWTPLPNTPSVSPLALASDGQNPATIYAYHLYNGVVFRSTDNGDTWTQTGFGGPNNLPISSLAVNTQDPAKLYATEYNGLFSSQDRGQSWTFLTGAGNNVTFLAADPISTTLLYARTTTSLLRSEDDGASWKPLGAGMPAFAFDQLIIDPHTPTTLYAAGSFGVLRSSDRGDNWTFANPGLPYPDYYPIPIQSPTILLDPKTPTTLYVVIDDNPDNSSDLQSVVYKSTDGARTWALANIGLPEIMSSRANLTVDPQTPSTLYLSASFISQTITTPELEGRLYKSTDGGATWRQLPFLWRDLLGGFVGRLAVDPQRASVVYALDGTRLITSVDGGDNWYALPAELPHDPYPYSYDMIVDPGTIGRIYLATSSGVQTADLSATLTVAVVVLGTPPAEAWTLTGPQGDFSLPAAGGAQPLGQLTLGAYDLSITPQPTYTVQSVCTQGIGAGAQAIAHAAAGQKVTCTFYAIAPDAPTSRLPVIGR